MNHGFSGRFGVDLCAAAPKILAGLSGLLLAGHALAAPVLVIPTNLQGWILADGSSGASPAAITGTQAYQGNGSIQLNISASNQQPLAAYIFASPVTVGSLLNSNMSFGYSWLLPVGSPPATSPTIRLLLSGLTNSAQTGGRTDGSLGFYTNGAGDGTWHTDTFSMTSGDFFFRIGGKGQEALDCATGSFAGSFDDRRQTLANWATNCTGAGAGAGTVDLDDANVIGIEVDWGTFTTTGAVSAFADRVNFSIGTNVGDYNFEVTAGTVPEPAGIALSLLALGMAGAVTAKGRRRDRCA